MNRPQITKEMVFEAAKQIAQEVGGEAETIADFYRHPMDGYRLARELDRYAGWDPTVNDVKILDRLCGIITDSLHKRSLREEKDMGQIGCIGHDGDCCKTREQDLKDAERYRWLKARLIGVDFNWNESDVTAMMFELPGCSTVSVDCDATIDCAMMGANAGSKAD